MWKTLVVGQYLGAILGDGNGDLPLGGELAVAGNDNPILTGSGVGVGVQLDVVAALVDHRLDGEHHAGHQQHIGASSADIADPRVFVEGKPYAVTADFADDGVAVFMGVVGDCLCNVSQKSPGLDLFESQLDTFFGNLYQLFCFLGYLTDAEHTGGVGEVAVVDGGYIDIDDVAAAQHHLFRRDAVADLVVDRGADALREAFIVERSRDAA